MDFIRNFFFQISSSEKEQKPVWNLSEITEI